MLKKYSKTKLKKAISNITSNLCFEIVLIWLITHSKEKFPCEAEFSHDPKQQAKPKQAEDGQYAVIAHIGLVLNLK